MSEGCNLDQRKRNNSDETSSIFNRFLKRPRTDREHQSALFGSRITKLIKMSTHDSNTNINGDKANQITSKDSTQYHKKSGKISVEKNRQKEIKARLQVEASQQMYPLAVGTVAMMASALANQALPKLLGKLLDEKNPSLNNMSCSSSSTSATSAILAVVIGGGLASFLRTTMLNRAQDNIAKSLRTKLFGSILIERDMEWFVVGSNVTASNRKEADSLNEEQSTSQPISVSPGAIGSILTEDITRASESVTVTFANILRGCSSCAFATYHMISLNATLFAVSVSVVPVVGMAAVALNKFVKKATVMQRECAEKAAAFAEERISLIETVKLSNREVDEVTEYIRLQEECVRLGRKVSAAKGTFMGFMFAASGGALYMVFNAGGKAIAEGHMTHGQLTSFATYSFLLGLGTSGIFKAMGESSQGLVSGDRVYRLIDGSVHQKNACNKVKFSKNKTVIKESVSSISLEQVSFSYQSSPDKLVLNEVSLSLPRGKVVALVGKNGSGKTTMASLIAGLYVPQCGQITIQPSGENFNELSRTSQTALIQVVTQQPALFDSSIRSNIMYSNPNVSEKKIQKTLQLANCNEFISSLDGGLDFCVGRNGQRLSGGQRQRLALVRALLTDPCLLILDEPTSALDAEGEGAVLDAVHACRSPDDGRMMGLLLITHRASTLQVADLVVVLEGGQIVEQGTFDELSRKKDSKLCELMTELI